MIRVAAVIAALALWGCASGIDLTRFAAGEPRAEIIQELGPPTSAVFDCDIYRWSRLRMAERATMLTLYQVALIAPVALNMPPIGFIASDVEWLGHDSMFCYDHDQLLVYAEAVH